MGAGASSAKVERLDALELAPEVVLSASEFRPLELEARVHVSADTVRLRWTLPRDGIPGLNVSSCVMVRATVDGEEVVRPYTPVTGDETPGSMDLVVKVYPKGKMSRFLAEMPLGEAGAGLVAFKGPMPKLPYVPGEKREVGFICAGSGITPCLQVLRAICRSRTDTTRASMVFVNRNEVDIICRDELEALLAEEEAGGGLRVDAGGGGEGRLRVRLVLTRPPEDGSWKGGAGHLNEAMVRDYLPAPANDVMMYVCGPPRMMDSLCGPKLPDKSQGPLVGLLKDMGYNEGNVYKF